MSSKYFTGDYLTLIFKVPCSKQPLSIFNFELSEYILHMILQKPNSHLTLSKINAGCKFDCLKLKEES